MPDQAEPPHDVAICCVPEDAETALELAALLPGRDTSAAVADDADAKPRGDGTIVVLLSAASGTSATLGALVRNAEKLYRPILVVRLADVAPSRSFGQIKSAHRQVDAFDAEGRPLLEPVVAALQSMTAKRALNPWSMRGVRLVVYALLAIGFLQLDPWGLAQVAKLHSQNLFHHIIATSYADDELPDWLNPAYGGVMEPFRWNRNVTVLLVDDDLLEVPPNDSWTKADAQSWPVPLMTHAEILTDLYETYHPDAIMVDILFVDERKVDAIGIKALADLYERIRQDDQTTVFQAVMRGRRLLPALQGSAVPVQIEWDVNSGVRTSPLYYPLASKRPVTLRHVAQTPDDDEGPAFAIYRHLCKDGTWAARGLMKCADPKADFRTQYDVPMSVYWGANAPDLNWEQANRGISCRPQRQWWLSRLVEMVWLTVSGQAKDLVQTCPYPQVIKARDFVLKRFRGLDDVDAAYRNAMGQQHGQPPKIVFYGVDFRGTYDRIDTPSHRGLPGVFLHAMALDNLLTLGPDGYIRAYPTNDWRHIAVTSVVAFAMAGIAILFRDGRVAARRSPGSCHPVVRAFAWTDRGRAGAFAFWLSQYALTLAVLWTAALIAFFWMRLAPINWLGFFALNVAISYDDPLDRERWASRGWHWLKTRMRRAEER